MDNSLRVSCQSVREIPEEFVREELLHKLTHALLPFLRAGGSVILSLGPFISRESGFEDLRELALTALCLPIEKMEAQGTVWTHPIIVRTEVYWGGMDTALPSCSTEWPAPRCACGRYLLEWSTP